MFSKQNKGKDLQKIPTSKLSNGPYYLSHKFDGHYVQIIYDGRMSVEMYTSGGKRFMLEGLYNDIVNNIHLPFHIECEYIYNCDGKLGSRSKSAKLTTYRTAFNKDDMLLGDSRKDTFIILDRLDMPSERFSTRLNSIMDLFYGFEGWFLIPEQMVCTLNEGIDKVKEFVYEGWEGGMLKHINHRYQPGKRTNDIIKLKPRKTGDFIVGIELEGGGKYEGKIGSLELLDRDGFAVGFVGSGLSDNDRKKWGHFVDKVVEVEYERFDSALVQPTFKCIRGDKTQEDCDSIKEGL